MDSQPSFVEENAAEVIHSVPTQKQMSEAILDAFQETSVDVLNREVRLQDKLDVDALDGLGWTRASSLRLEFTLWEHRVEIRPETIRLYERS